MFAKNIAPASAASSSSSLDNESLCVVPTKGDHHGGCKSSSSFGWTHAFVVLAAFACGAVSNKILDHQSSGSTGCSAGITATTPTSPFEIVADAPANSSSPFHEEEDHNEDHYDDHKDTLEAELLMDKLRREILADLEHRSLTETNETDDLLGLDEEDEDAEVETSIADEIDYDNEVDFAVEIEEEDEDDDEEEDLNQVLDYNETLEEMDEVIDGLYDLTDADEAVALVEATNSSRRRLDGNVPKIQPLPCNADNATWTAATCSANKLSSLIASAVAGQPIVVPCGACYEVDTLDGSTLDFPDGLVIKGKLFFPSNADVTIRTKYVFVRGILQIIPRDSPSQQVKFSLYKEDKVSFVNDDEPSGVCSGTGCNMGSKVIAVVGGQLDIQGVGPNCRAWEKLQGTGTPHPKEYQPPTDSAGTPLDLEIAGACRESPGHTRRFKKYTVWCPIKRTISVRHGTRDALTLTNVEPPSEEDLPKFTPPTNGWSLKVKDSCRVSWGHTRRYKKCMLYCPIHNTNSIHRGDSKPMTFTSVKPEVKPFVKPTPTFKLKIRGRCYESRGHSRRFRKYTVRCPLDRTSHVRWGQASSLKFTNPATDESITATRGVMHWAWRGRNMYFFPDAKDHEVSKIFPPGSEMVVNYSYDQEGGQTFDVAKVFLWSWRGRFTFFHPEGFNTDECSQAAKEFNQKFPSGYGIDVSYRRHAPVDGGQTITASKGVHHWAWGGNRIFFHPDVNVAEVNRLFPPGYKMEVAYSSHTHVSEVNVSPEAASCWGVGTELLLSSHTHRAYDRQTAVVTGADPVTGTLTLNHPVEKPITLADNADFAIEIASLKRPVVFEADDDAGDASIGGHLIVFKTELYQHLEGVQIKNFGQLGRLGRYPIHFHMCGTTSNSVVKKNVVHDSNQRAYVMHCSDNVSVEENVAYNIPGHTYFLEAGSETGTVFRNNLGVLVKNMPARGVNGLQASSKRHESDDAASTFWISNPDNYFYGNVAAGSQKHGFWFETRSGGTRGKNTRAFEDNEAHSCHSHAFTSYPPGWRPNAVNTIKNLKIYRNSGNGLFLHVTRNLFFDGGIIADNKLKSVFLFRADDVTFKDTVFIGQSEWAPRGCHPRLGGVGLSLNPSRLNDRSDSGTIKGTSMIGTKFHNWSKQATGCSNPKPIAFNNRQVFTKAFAAPHSMKDVFVDSDAPEYKVDVCSLENGLGIEDSVVEIESDMNKLFSPDGDAGFLASAKVATMLPDGACADYNKCLKFCPGACLRTVSVRTSSGNLNSGIKMIIKDTVSQKTLEVKGQNRGFSVRHTFHTTFTAALPKPEGSYEVSFVDEDNQLVWPGYAYPVYEAAPSCTTHLATGDLTFVKPHVATCSDEIVKNGNFDSKVQGWQTSRNTGFIFGAGRGLDGSNAMLTTGSAGAQRIRGLGFSQYLDANCLVAGATYDVLVSYRQVDKFGATVTGCAGGVGDTDCPSLDIKAGGSWAKIAYTDLSSYTNDNNSFNTISGQWTVTSAQASASMVRVAIDHYVNQLIVDRVSLKRVS